MNVILARPHVGQVVNLKAGTYRVVAVGAELHMLPGGRRKHEAHCMRICDGPLTRNEIKRLEDKPC